MIKLRNIVKVYGTKSGIVTTALDDVSLDLPKSGIVFILGKSGCGKTTLLNILGGLDSPTSGEYSLGDIYVSNLSESALNKFRNDNVGFVFQDFNLIDEYNVGKNVEFSLDLQGNNGAKEIAKEALVKVGLEGYEQRRVRELSGGQKQRVAIARAIAKDSKFILADEPTGNLDSATSKEIFELLKDIAKDKLVIVVSHDDESAEEYADRIITLHDGVLLSDNVPAFKTPSIESVEYDNSNAPDIATAYDGDILENEKIINDDVSATVNVSKCTEKLNIPQVRASVDVKCMEKKNKSYVPIVKDVFAFAFRNMWHRKIRLVSTIMLLVVSMVCFGFSLATVGYDHLSIMQSTYEDYPFELRVKTYDPYDYGHLGDERSQALIDGYDESLVMPLYYGVISNLLVLDEKQMETFGYEIIHGEGLPSDYTEVSMTKFMADKYLAGDRYVYGEPDAQGYGQAVEVDSYEELIGLHIFDGVMDEPMTIVSIVDTHVDEYTDAMVEYAMETKGEDNDMERIMQDIDEIIDDFEHNSHIVAEEYITDIKPYGGRSNEARFNFEIKYWALGGLVTEEVLYTYETSSFKAMQDLSPNIYMIDDKTSLSDNEVLVDLDTLSILTSHKTTIEKPKLTLEEQVACIEEGLYIYDMKTGLFVWWADDDGDIVTRNIEKVRVVGYYENDDLGLLNGFVLNDNLLYEDNPCMSVGDHSLIIKLSDNEADNNQLISNIYNQDLREFSLYSDSLHTARGQGDANQVVGNGITPMMVWLFLGIGAGVIAGMVMLSYIGGIIYDSRKKIGMLRAMGMSMWSIASIYLIEAVLVSIVAIILGIVTVIPLSKIPLLNSGMGSFFYIYVLVIGAPEIIAIIGLGLGLAIAGAIVPILLNSKKSPNQLLRGK